MRTFPFLFVPALASAFHSPKGSTTFNRGGGIGSLKDDILEKVIDKVADEVADKTETTLGKFDDLIGKRAFTAANHAPALYTLYGLGKALGSSKFGLDAAANAFQGPAAAVALPSYTGYLWPAAIAAQLVSAAKSSIADTNEVSQTDITATSLANYAATQAATTGGLPWLVTAAVASSYQNRNGGDLEAGFHTLSLQIMSSLTTVMAILALVTKACSFVPLLDGKDEIVSLLGLYGFYAHAKRQGNGVVKKVINAGMVLGILYSKVTGGLDLTSVASILSLKTLSLVGTVGIAFVTSMKAKEALMS